MFSLKSWTIHTQQNAHLHTYHKECAKGADKQDVEQCTVTMTTEMKTRTYIMLISRFVLPIGNYTGRHGPKGAPIKWRFHESKYRKRLGKT